jgi:hypothetical protein
MAQRQCEMCKKVFEYNPPLNFPDKRKYCDDCSAKKAASYAASKLVPTEAPKAQEKQELTPLQAFNISKHDVVVTRTDKPHSYEFGKAGARHKIYYNDIRELKEHIDALKEAGLTDEINLEDLK